MKFISKLKGSQDFFSNFFFLNWKICFRKLTFVNFLFQYHSAKCNRVFFGKVKRHRYLFINRNTCVWNYSEQQFYGVTCKLRQQLIRRLPHLPHLLCDRLYPDKILKKSDNRLHLRASFNDIATTRAACLQSLGWALLPRYTVKSEIDEKKLVVIDSQSSGVSNYGVWWIRDRKSIEPLALNLKSWLETIKL